MINVQKQIEYCMEGAIDDLETAKILIERKRVLHGLFFCHLVIEKSIKAHVVKSTSEIAPRSHNLLHLLEKTNLKLNEDEELLKSYFWEF